MTVMTLTKTKSSTEAEVENCNQIERHVRGVEVQGLVIPTGEQYIDWATYFTFLKCLRPGL